MAVLALSNRFVGHHGAAYGLLLAATGMLGAGFGATLTPLNIFVVSFFPSKPSTALTSLHAILGTGTAPRLCSWHSSSTWVGGGAYLLGLEASFCSLGDEPGTAVGG